MGVASPIIQGWREYQYLDIISSAIKKAKERQYDVSVVYIL